MNSWVLDASVAAKWYLPSKDEPLADEAVAVLKEFASGRCNLVVPDLFWPETGNILWKATRLGRITAATATDAMNHLLSLGITTSSSVPLAGQPLQIALSFERSVYDSTYIALALASSRPFLTADERVVNALGSRFPVRWLGAIPQL